MRTEDDDYNQPVETVPSGRPPDHFEAEPVEIILRCEITIKNNNKDDRGLHLCHAAVLHQMHKSFTEDELQIINNQNKWIQLPNYQKWTTEAYCSKHFETHTLPGKGGRPNRHFVIHRIRTTLLLSTIKNDRRVLQALQENNVFLGRHYFLEDEWNMVNLGFLLFLDPSKHLWEDARQKNFNLLPNNKRHKIGDGERFQLVAGSPFLHLGGRRIPTKAYTAVCLRHHASAIDDLLKRIYNKTCHYVKFCLLHKNKQAYYQALTAQNNYLSTIRMIPIIGISTQMMQSLDECFWMIHGVTDVVRSYTTETNRRWNILTDKKNFHQVLQFISFWLLDFQGVYERPDDFPAVRVKTQVAEHNSSTGECSYMSMSAISYGSYDTNGSYSKTENRTNPIVSMLRQQPQLKNHPTLPKT
jgi:hypothetical protein